MSTLRTFVRNAIAFALFGLAIQDAAASFSYDYDASTIPDDPSLQNVFSTFTPSGTGWSTSGGQLTITTTALKAVDFGNAPYDPVPWNLGDSTEGNFLSVRSRLGNNSQDWYVYLSDGVNEAYMNFFSGQTLYGHSTGVDTYMLDGTAFHWYTISLLNGLVTYSIDGSQIFSGTAALTGSIPGNTEPPHYVALLIGDIWGSGNRGTGSMIVDEVLIRTPVPTSAIPAPAAIWLLLSGLATLIGFVKLRGTSFGRCTG